MKIWYAITPADTLFFRGSEPLEAGQPSRETLFPPPVSVVQGALRTALLKQKGIAFADYKAGRYPDEIRECIGECSQPAPFHVTAILLIRQDAIYAPCPAHWFVDGKELPSNDEGLSFTGSTLLRAELPAPTAAPLLLHSQAGLDLPLVRARDAQSLAGFWLRLECLRKPPARIAKDDLLASNELYDVEPRTGIAIDSKRKVRQGYIYSASHIRLRPAVSMLIGLDRDPGLAEKGRLSLGGEQRICGYARRQMPNLPNQPAALYGALAPVELTEEIRSAVFATGKTSTLAGWDLARGFHKATSTWLPAGTVFTHNVASLCIPLP